MGFITQIIFLHFWGFFSAKWYSQKLRAKNEDWIAFLAIIGLSVAWLWGILVYLNVIPIAKLVNWIPWVNVTDGKDWMWNSFQVFGIDFGIQHQPGMNSIAVIIFLLYPAIYHFGQEQGQMMFGKRTYEQGYWWALQPVRKPKNYQKK